jgi:hypothetical protein
MINRAKIMHHCDFYRKAQASVYVSIDRIISAFRSGLILLVLVVIAGPVWAGQDQAEQRADLREKLQLLKRETISASELVDRKRLSFDAVIQATGNNPQDIYNWVKTNTRPLPYRGILKGALGVLIERQGNSLDRSLLLVELIERAGYRAKLANVKLNDSAMPVVKTLVSAELERPAMNDVQGDFAWTDQELANHQTEIAKVTGVSRDVAQEGAGRKEQKAAKAMAQLMDEANHQAKVILRKLPLPTLSSTSLLTQSLESLEDHWWVVASVDGENVMFDFFFEQQNTSLKELGYSNDNPVKVSRENLPEDLYHHVTFRIMADKISMQGEDNSAVVLEHTLRTEESRLQAIDLSFTPMARVLKANSAESFSAEHLRKKLAQQQEWVPALQIGDERYSQSSIRADGSLGLNPKLPRQGVMALSNSFSRKRQTPEEVSPSRNNYLTEVRLEVEIEGGGNRTKEIRVLFDIRDQIAKAMLDGRKRKAGLSSVTAKRKVSEASKQQAALKAKRDACSKQAGVEHADLWVLEKDADLSSMESIELFGELAGSDKCMALQSALAYAKPVAARKIGQGMSPKSAAELGLSKGLQSHRINLPEDLRVTRAEKLMRKQQFLVLPFTVTDTYLTEQFRIAALQHQGALIKLLDSELPVTPQKVVEKLEGRARLDLKLLSFALLRQQPESGVPFAITQANLVSTFSMMSVNKPSIEVSTGMDIIVNAITPLSRDPDISRLTAIRQGVIDTMIENHLVASGLDRNNTAHQFKSDIDNNSVTEWIASPVDHGLKNFPDVRRADDSATLATLIYSPSRLTGDQLPASFWFVNNQTGQTLGYSNTGKGGVIETVIHIGAILRQSKDWIDYVICIAKGVKERCKLLACFINKAGEQVSSAAEGVMGAAFPARSAKDALTAFTRGKKETQKFVLQSLLNKLAEEKVTRKLVAQIDDATAQLAFDVTAILCNMGAAEPSIKSERASKSPRS